MIGGSGSVLTAKLVPRQKLGAISITLPLALVSSENDCYTISFVILYFLVCIFTVATTIRTFSM